jgi:hypothetical protein
VLSLVSLLILQIGCLAGSCNNNCFTDLTITSVSIAAPTTASYTYLDSEGSAFHAPGYLTNSITCGPGYVSTLVTVTASVAGQDKSWLSATTTGVTYQSNTIQAAGTFTV